MKENIVKEVEEGWFVWLSFSVADLTGGRASPGA